MSLAAVNRVGAGSSSQSVVKPAEKETKEQFDAKINAFAEDVFFH